MQLGKNMAPVVKTNWVSFAKGIHVLSFTETTYKPVLGAELSTLEMSSIITSTESVIAATNICCGDPDVGTTCYDDIGYGKANDRYIGAQFFPGEFYQVMIRMFPTYNIREIAEVNVPLELFNLAGSVYTVIFWFCLVLVTITRWTTGGCNMSAMRHENPKKMMTAP